MSELDTTDAPLPAALKQRGCAITGLLGSGGMGRVYAVEDPRLERVIALKVARGVAGSFAWQRLQREARVTARLDGVGVVAVHEVGTLSDGRPWFSMSLAEGRALSAILDAPLSQPERLQLVESVAQVAAFLAPIHRIGVVHRDLKPANIRIGKRVTLLDWGLARVLSAGDEETDPGVEQTREGARLGTPSRMSPEQAAGIAVDARADVWALGVLLWEVLAGETAYPGERAPAVITRVLQGPPSMAPVAWAGVALVGVIEGALSPLADRYADAGVLHDALMAALAPRPPRRWKPWIAGMVGMVLAAAGALWFRPEAPPAPAPAPSQLPELVASLAAAARDAAREGRRYRAELLAADALELGGETELRGLLLSPHPRPVLELDVEQPKCGIGDMLSPDASLLVCANPGFTAGYGIDEDGINLRWRQDVEIHQFQFLGLDIVLGQIPAQSSMVLLDAEHGGPILDSKKMATGWLMPSRKPGSLLRLSGSRRGREDWLTERVAHYDERPAPCAAQLAAILADGSELHACTGELIRIDGETLEVLSRWPLPTPEDRGMRMILDLSGERVALLLHSGHYATIDLDGEATWSASPIARAGSIAISPSGRYVALGTFLGTKVWERENPERLWLLPGRGKVVSFDRQERLILQGYDRVQRWRMPEDTGQVWSVGGRILELDWGGGGLLARRVDGTVLRWSDGAVIAEDATTVATASGHDRVAVGLSGGRVQVLGQPPVSVGDVCRSLEWFDADTLVCAPAGPGPMLIDAETGEVDPSVGLPGSSWFTASSQGTGTVALLEWSGAVFRLEGDPPRLTRFSTESWANTLALPPDGASVMLGGSWGAGRLDYATDTITERLLLPTRVSRLVWSPDGRWLAVTTYEGDLFLYLKGALVARTILSSSQTLLAAISPDSQQLALGGSAGLVEVFNLSELERPLAEVIAEVRAAWGAQ
ncbi:MAG: WD40 repeat protein [Myxococcota bacterium]|jgi:WD40 repeat protein